jgi:iron(III) transport system ATP-binding protein
MLMADDLALMSAGRLLQAASPEICYLNPASLAAARLLGAINAVPAEVKSGVAHSPFGSLATDLPDGPATLMLRPEALAFGPDGAAVTVTGVRFGGAFHQVRVEAQGIPAIVRAFGSEIPRAGPACVRLDPERARLFAA